MKSAFAIIILSLFLVELASAHGGRTNSSGCHNNRKTGGYHCHGGGQSYSGSSKSYSSAKKYSPPAAKPTITQSSRLILEVQKHLNKLGYKSGTEDGVIGKKTIEAIKRFQKDNNMTLTGKPTESLRSILRSKVKG